MQCHDLQAAVVLHALSAGERSGAECAITFGASCEGLRPAGGGWDGGAGVASCLPGWSERACMPGTSISY